MLGRRIVRLLLSSVAALALVAAALLLGVKLALDRAPRYQAQIKEWVHRQTGYHIAFSSVSPALRWYGPELTLGRPELRSRDDARVLARAARGRIGIDLWQLLRNGRLFALRLELESPVIAIDRLGPEKFALASEIVLGGDDTPVSSLTLDDLPAGTLAIHDGSVTLRHWDAQLPELALAGVDLDLSRLSHWLALKLAARLPPVLGGGLNVIATVQGPGPLATLRWDGAATADGMAFRGWRLLFPQYLERLESGTGGFRAAAHGRGEDLERVDLDFGAQSVVTRLSEDVASRMDEVGAALSLTHTADRWTLHGRKVRARRAGRPDPDSQFDVSWRENESGMLDLTARASYLRAEALLPLVGLMPQRDVRERLRELAPTGEWTDMRLALRRRTPGGAWQFDAHANFRDMGFAPVGRSPGLRGLSGSLAGNDSAGHVVLDSAGAAFHWPAQLPQPLPLQRLKGSIYWRRGADEMLIATSDLQLQTRAATLRGKAAWHQPDDGSSPVLVTAGTIENGNVADAHLYFPRELLPAGTIEWLDRAFIAGHLGRGDITFSGPILRFPFRDGGGLFLIRFDVDHLTLDYQAGWPRIQNLAAQAEFRNQGMSVSVTSAEVGGLEVDSGRARFADLNTGELEVHAAAHGDAAAAVAYLAATPLDAMTEHAFSTVQASGPLKADVDLFLPFRRFDDRRTLVHVDLNGATLRYAGSPLAATELVGGADIDGAQVARAELRGRVLGGPMQMSARPGRGRHATRTHVDFHGTLNGEALRATLGLPASVAVGGQADYRAVLRLAPEPVRERSLQISSSLEGLGVDLPAPLNKVAGAALPASVAVQWPPSGGEQINLSLGELLRATVVLNADPTGTKLGRAALSFGASAPSLSDGAGLNIGGRIEELDLAGWSRLAAAAGGTAGAGAAGRSASSLADYFRSARFDVGKIDCSGLSFNDVAVTIGRNEGTWHIGASGPSVEGSITLPGAQDPAAPWDLEFERFNVAGSAAANSGGNGPAAPPAASPTPLLDPRAIPPMVFHAAEVTWDDRQFGEVRAVLSRLDDGISLKQLTASNQDWNADVSAEWRGPGSGASRIRGTISSTDVGNTLKQLGFAAVVQAKSGYVSFDLGWPGGPGGDVLAQAKGRVQVTLEKGQIVGLKPGAGRVLGLASVAELPRRLALDFSDLTDKGFAFDRAHGDFDLHDGSAYTDNVLVKGPAAEIGLIGRVGLKSRDYDQTAVVTGNVGSSLPLAAFAAGPVVGGAVLLFTQVFKQPLKGLVRGYYRIAGSWDDPTVERIKSGDPSSEEAKQAAQEAEKEAPAGTKTAVPRAAAPKETETQ